MIEITKLVTKEIGINNKIITNDRDVMLVTYARAMSDTITTEV